MANPRIYGSPPYTLAVVHGGPGAAGSMAPVARELGAEWGVLEPLQTEASLDGQVAELRALLLAHARLPVTLVGSSWGAMLSLILAARHPELVARLILVGSGVYDARYAQGIEQTRLERLSEAERREIDALLISLNGPAGAGRDDVLRRLGAIFARADSYDPLPHDDELLEVRFDVFQQVWGEAEALRASGELLELARQVRCPVLAIHGSYDPHPAEGVRAPLAAAIADFRFVLLEECGHEPWYERRARARFFAILQDELREARRAAGETSL